MKDFANSLMLGDFARAFDFDLNSVRDQEFPCCPVIALAREHGTIVGRFTGEIGLPRIEEFRQALKELMSCDLEKIIVDFHAVSLTRTAMGVLVNFAANVQGNNKKLYLYRPSGQIRALLVELELSLFFSILEDEDDVLARLIV